MSKSLMTLSEELLWRGFVNQTTLTDLKQLDNKKLTFYHGFDASSDSQTVGNLAAMMFDKVFMRHGYKAVMLAGGSTSLIGDPGGKDAERPLQDEQTIAHNVRCAEEQLKRILKGHEFQMVNNLDWTKDLSVIHFLRDVGKYFSMTPLIQRDYIASRIGEGGAGISYAEFSYTILQGMDYLHLYDNYDTTLQLGGSDQWGNCLSGVELIRRARGVETHVITLNLVINKTTGKKFGKSEDGAVWLDPKKTTPTQFYQFWINSGDQDVEDYIKIFTELSKLEVDKIMATHQKDPKERHAQIRLAEEVTMIVHGQEDLKVAQEITQVLTGQKTLAGLDKKTIVAMRQEIPTTKATVDSEIIEVLVACGLATSKTEAKRFIAENAISINGQKTNQELIQKDDFINDALLLRRGKSLKDTALIEKS